MNVVFVIGLPKPIRKRLEADAVRNSMRIHSVLCDIGPKGSLMLLPYPSQTIHNLRAYVDSTEKMTEVRILALEYAEIPGEVYDELETIADLGGEVSYRESGKDDWPSLQKGTRPSTGFYNKLHASLKKELFPEAEELPSTHFIGLRQRTSHVYFSNDALVLCDKVAAHRREFLIRAAQAFEVLIENQGKVGGMDAFFAKHGLEFATTGGIATILQVFNKGGCVYEKKSHVHLKQGDKTSPQAAARIYFHAFYVGEAYYVAVVYAGPHPEKDVAVKWHIDGENDT